jgi:hypothetical protein
VASLGGLVAELRKGSKLSRPQQVPTLKKRNKIKKFIFEEKL